MVRRRVLSFLVVFILCAGSAMAKSAIRIELGIGADAEYNFAKAVDFADSFAPAVMCSLENQTSRFLPLKATFFYRVSKFTFWDEDASARMTGALELKLLDFDVFEFYLGGGVITNSFLHMQSGTEIKPFGTVNASAKIYLTDTVSLYAYTAIPAVQITGAIDIDRGKSVDVASIPDSSVGLMLTFGLNK